MLSSAIETFNAGGSGGFFGFFLFFALAILLFLDRLRVNVVSLFVMLLGSCVIASTWINNRIGTE